MQQQKKHQVETHAAENQKKMKASKLEDNLLKLETEEKNLLNDQKAALKLLNERTEKI